MQLPVARRHAAFLPIAPSRIVFDRRPGFLWRERDHSSEPAHRTRNIEPHQHATDIENDGAKVIALRFFGCQILGFQWITLFRLPEVLLRSLSSRRRSLCRDSSPRHFLWHYSLLRGVREEC